MVFGILGLLLLSAAQRLVSALLLDDLLVEAVQPCPTTCGAYHARGALLAVCYLVGVFVLLS